MTVKFGKSNTKTKQKAGGNFDAFLNRPIIESESTAYESSSTLQS